MSRKAFDRDVYRDREAPFAIDMNRNTGEGAHAGLRELLRFAGGPPISLSSLTTQQVFGFYGDSFLVLPQSPASTTVSVSAGLGAYRNDADQPASIGGIPGLDEDSAVKPVVLRDPFLIATPPPPAAPDSRIDIIEVRIARDFYDAQPVPMLDLPSAIRQYPVLTKTLSYALDGLSVEYVPAPANSTQPIAYKTGIAAPVPVAPATSPGYTKIAEVLIENAVTNPAGTVRQEHISDFRRMLFIGGTASFRVIYSFAYGVLSPPTVLFQAVPPGIRLALYRGVIGTTVSGVFVLNNCDVAFDVGSPKLGTAVDFDLVRGEMLPLTAVDPGNKGLIDSAASTFPAQKVAVGQPARAIQSYVINWGGVTFADSTADPQTVIVTGTLS